MALDSFECKILTGGYNHCDHTWNKPHNEIDQCFKIYLPVKGEGIIYMDDTPVRIIPGNIYFLSGFNISSQECTSAIDIYWLHFIPASLYLRRLLLKLESSYVWKVKDFAFTEQFKKHIRWIFRDKDYTKQITLSTPYSYEEAKLQVCVLDLVAEILKNSPVEHQEKTDELLKLEPSLKFMNNEFRSNPSLEAIASKSAMAPNYFHRIFKKNFGVTPFKYMQRRRMEIAIRMLRTSSKCIKEIAFEAGYDNEYFFYRQFKKYAGYCPGEVRKNKPF